MINKIIILSDFVVVKLINIVNPNICLTSCLLNQFIVICTTYIIIWCFPWQGWIEVEVERAVWSEGIVPHNV